MKMIVAGLLITIMTACANIEVWAGDIYEVESLKNVAAINVIVAETHNAAIRKENIQTNTEMLLRKAGIKVAMDSDDLTYLFIVVLADKIEDTDLYSYFIDVSFIQPACLLRDNNICNTMKMWTAIRRGSIGAYYIKQVEMDAIEPLIYEFINDYLKANS